MIPNGVTCIGNYAFNACRSLSSIVIPNSVTSIGKNAFINCRALTSITIPNTVSSIGDFAFQGCEALTSVTIGNGVMSLAEGVFSYCSNIKNVTLPEKLQSIRKDAFKYCSALTALTIPASVEYIYQEAFSGCNALTQIRVLPTTPPFLYDNSFSNYSVPLKVPKGCIEAYQTANGWKNFSDISDTYKLTYIIDNEEYKSYKVYEGENIIAEEAPTKEGYTFSGWSEIPETMPAQDVMVIGSFNINSYTLTYMIDNAVYKSVEFEYGATITAEEAPTKEGCTFSGWSEIPETMPAHDVTVSAVFTNNKYKVTYMVDGKEYKSIEVEYGAAIISVAEPVKEGYTFSGWSWIPSKMPAEDVTISGSFTVNKYKLTYTVDGEEYKSNEVEYGAAITPEVELTKEGYTFSGWEGIPETMPAHDVTISGTFTINQYMVRFIVDGEVLSEQKLDYGTAIVVPEVAVKVGYTFSGWDEVPETVPAKDVTVTGTFTVNSYTLLYMVDGKEYKKAIVDYGTSLTAETAPEKEGYTFSGWSEIPEAMPAHDVTVTGTFIVNKYKVRYYVGDQLIAEDEVEYGAEVVLREFTPDDASRYSFIGWDGETYATMPAHDIEYHANIVDGIVDLSGMANNVEAIYDTNGRKRSKPQSGVNILLMRDGSKKKLLVK